MADTYQNFDLSIEPDGAAGYRARVLASPAGQAEASFLWPFTPQDLEIFVLRMGQTRSTTRRHTSSRAGYARDFGRQLYETIFDGDVGTCLVRSFDAAERSSNGLRVRLSVRDCPDLADVPWEYLYVPALNRFLVVSSQTPLVRYVDLARTIRPLAVDPPLHVLVIVSNPTGVNALQVDEEWRKVQSAVADLEAAGLLHVSRLEAATLADLQDELRDNEVHVLHFIGHGDFDEDSGRGVLYFEDELGGAQAVTSESLGTVLHDHRSLRLVVLNSCEGARSSAREPFGGTAIGLIGQGIPAVVSMQFEITDRAAIEFSHEFYQALADRFPIDAAVGEGRKRLYAIANDSNEWGTPVLHMRSPDGRIFDLRDAPQPAPRKVVRDPEPIERAAAQSEGSNLLTRRSLMGGAAALAVAGGAFGAWQLRKSKPLSVNWTFATGDQIFSSPAVSDDLVYVGSNDHRLYAVETSSGAEHWRYVTGGAVTSSPVVDGGIVYVGSNDGSLHAVDAATGVGIWKHDTGAIIHSSPAVAEGMVCVGSRDNRLHALDARTGALRWTFGGGDWFNSSPSIDRGAIYIGCRDHEVYVVDAETGTKITNYTTDSTVDSSATIVGDSFFIGADDRRIYALRTDDNATFGWKHETDGGVVSTPAYADSVVYAGSMDGSLYAVDATTGRRRWRYETGNGIRSSPIVDRGVVYVGSRDRAVHAVDVTTGEQIATFETNGPIDDSSPAVHGDQLFIGSLDGSLYALAI